MARTLAQGAISGKAQQINGAALGQMIGSGASNISRASKAYNKLDSSLTKAIQWAGGEQNASAGEILDGQFFLESAVASGNYSGDMLELLKDMRDQIIKFAQRGTLVGSDNNELGRGFTDKNGLRYLSDEQKGSLQNQLSSLVTHAHERERDGRGAEASRAVIRHAQMGSLLDSQFGGDFGRGWQKSPLQKEIAMYRSGDLAGLMRSAHTNYDHSADNLTELKTRKVIKTPIFFKKPQHAFTISIPDMQEDFDFSEEARKKDSRIFEVLNKDGQPTGKYGFIFSASFDQKGRLRNRGKAAAWSGRDVDVRIICIFTITSCIFR